FSGRRRHTRSKRDWSSDVCSSDLLFFQIENGNRTSVFLQFASVPLKIHLLTVLFGVVFSRIEMALLQTIALNIVHNLIHKQLIRSEERRVGKGRNYRLRTTQAKEM